MNLQDLSPDSKPKGQKEAQKGDQGILKAISETFPIKIVWTVIELYKQKKDETIGTVPQSRFKRAKFLL